MLRIFYFRPSLPQQCSFTLRDASCAPETARKFFPNFTILLRKFRPDPGQRNLSGDFQTIRFKSDELPGVVGENTHGANIQCSKNLSADAVFTLFASEADSFVRIDAMLPVIFEESNSGPRPAHVIKVEKNSAARLRNHIHRAVHLFVAMTSR